MFRDERALLEALDTFLSTLPCSAYAVWLRMHRPEPFMLLTSQQPHDTWVPLLLPSTAVDELPSESILLRLPLPMPLPTLPPLFHEPGLLVQLRWIDGIPHALLWCKLQDGSGPDTLVMTLERVLPLLEAVLEGIMTSVTLEQLWLLSSSPLCVIDPEWTVVAANPAFSALVGQPAAGRKLEDLVRAFPSWDRLRALLKSHHRATDNLVLATDERLATFRVDAQRIPSSFTDQASVAVLLHFGPKEQGSPAHLRDEVDLDALLSDPVHLTLPAISLVLTRRTAKSLPTTLIIGFLSCATGSSLLECLVHPNVSTTLLEQLRHTLQPILATPLDPSTLVAITDQPASPELVETLHVVRETLSQRFPHLAAWPFIKRLTFAVIPVADRSIVDEEALFTLVQRTRQLVSRLDRPVVLFSPDEVNPAPPSLTAIAEALLAHRFSFWAQPITPLQLGQPPRIELLARLTIDELVLSPAFFLPLVQELGLHTALPRAAIEHASRLAATGTIVHVNADPSALLELAATGQLSSLGQRHLRNHLVLEITDSHVGVDMSLLYATLDLLRQQGIGIALDDFGVGFQGCLPLIKLPIDVVKVDRALTRELACGRGMALAESLVQCCRRLGITTVFEGIEDAELLPVLESWGVDYVQGFATGHPYPVSVGT